MFDCVRVCVRVYMCVVCMCIGVCVFVCMRACARVCVRMCMRVRLCVRVCMTSTTGVCVCVQEHPYYSVKKPIFPQISPVFHHPLVYKEPYISAIEPYISAIEPYDSSHRIGNRICQFTTEVSE